MAEIPNPRRLLSDAGWYVKGWLYDKVAWWVDRTRRRLNDD